MCPRRRASAACSPVGGDAAMAMDFPVHPVDMLPIFPDEAASAAALMDLIGGASRGGEESSNGSRGAVVGGCGHTVHLGSSCVVLCAARRGV